MNAQMSCHWHVVVLHRAAIPVMIASSQTASVL